MKRTRTDPTELRSFLYELSKYPGRSQSGWGTFSGVKYYSLPLSNIGTGLSNRPNINRLHMIFSLEKKKIGEKTKQVPVIRYKDE